MTSLPSTSTTAAGTGAVPLGDTGIDLHPLCLGGNVFGWSADEQASHAVLDAYAEAGGNLVDTADVYSAWVPGHTGGESEAVIGRWLGGRHPGGGAVQVATKTGAAEGAQLSPSAVDEALDASLGRLGLDSVALYYAHRDQPERPVEEVVRAFAATVTSGRARAWAVSNWSAERIDAAVAAAQEAGLPGPVAVQNAGSAVTRTDPAVVDACRRHGLLALPYGALASGFLTGKYSRGGEVPESVRAEGVGKRFGDERSWAVLDAVRAVAQARGAELGTVALAWLRAQGAVPIASARTPEQLPALLAVTAVELSADELESITTAGL
ncbi:aldo/keto reductase [Quadrisphaera setariae]|uniref:Aldo/keto reductase n=1 Tax=Quadrisphaera setariae TaxID=2593304 RepID=A0A5C8ZGF5_9ACTN|nr:aldo/keto reductase [Quadrisphaera setariae]TXR56006.1 aldo/keto reductase [Quadrisphaera setariae]